MQCEKNNTVIVLAIRMINVCIKMCLIKKGTWHTEKKRLTRQFANFIRVPSEVNQNANKLK